jgi:hypothetical protein
MDSMVTRLDPIGLFFMRPYQNKYIYKTTVKDLNNLKNRITQEINAIKNEKLHNVFLAIQKTD